MIIGDSRKGRRVPHPGSMSPMSSKGGIGCSSLLAYLITFIILPAVSVCSCSKTEGVPEEKSELIEEVQKKELKTEISLASACSWAGIQWADVFVYSSLGTLSLENHFRTDTFPLRASLTEGEKIIVVLANSKARFNLTALSRMDSMEMLSYSFKDDDGAFPLMSGREVAIAGSKVIVEQKPIMCRAILLDVSNNLPGYALLENPRIFLSGMNPSCEVLKEEEFRPVQIMEEASKTVLDCDVGFFTRRYGACLYCYPNDTPENILGTQQTCFNFECEIEGHTVLFSSPLPPTKRNSTVEVSLTVESDSEFKYEFSMKN